MEYLVEDTLARNGRLASFTYNIRTDETPMRLADRVATRTCELLEIAGKVRAREMPSLPSCSTTLNPIKRRLRLKQDNLSQQQ